MRQERADRRVARICMIIANRFRSSKEQVYTISDFMPKYGKDGDSEGDTMSPEQMKQMVLTLHGALGGEAGE